MASKVSAASCAVKHLVDATPISGPARVYSTRYEARGMAESTTLQMAEGAGASRPCLFDGRQGVGGLAALGKFPPQIPRSTTGSR